ncbi:guanine nucleotide binding protein, alpha subunit [Chytriomyces sp. MP71]|nr:guanine nucleotide binding protein, alpha subunit [Chytriomyces sp. MP71]
MGGCLVTQSLEEVDAVTNSKNIDKQLRLESAAVRQIVKILLLGAGETGKSTILKQMKLIHGVGFTEDERTTFRSVLLLNIMTCAKTLVKAMKTLQIPYSFDASTVQIQAVVAGEGNEGTSMPIEVQDAIKVIWTDPGVRYCYSRNNEYQLLDSCSYFLDNFDRILSPDYTPTDQDILASRVMTTRVTEINFRVQEVPFKVFDLGGQRSERKKWVPYFDDVKAIMFLVAISAYDQVCYEDNSTNRMIESMTLFSSVCNHQAFKTTAMMVFMNKIDIFKTKLKSSPIANYFPTFTGSNTYENASDFFSKQFVTLNKSPEKKIYVHYTWATDTNQMTKVLSTVNHIILSSNMDDSGL